MRASVKYGGRATPLAFQAKPSGGRTPGRRIRKLLRVNTEGSVDLREAPPPEGSGLVRVQLLERAGLVDFSRPARSRTRRLQPTGCLSCGEMLQDQRGRNS